MIVVEGESDRVALETLARRRELPTPEIAVLGGAHAIAHFVAGAPRDAVLVGLCDANEEPVFRRVLERVHVCEPDLEGELIRALGVDRVEALFETQGELSSFRTLQMQPAQQGRPLEAQLARFLSGRSGNKQRYARLFVEALDLARAPTPLDGALL